jgi:hypothetical protein
MSWVTSEATTVSRDWLPVQARRPQAGQWCPEGVWTKVYSPSTRSPVASWPMRFTRFTHAGSARKVCITERTRVHTGEYNVAAHPEV